MKMLKRKRNLPSLSLRHKIFLILGCYILGILVMAIVSQDDLSTAREKLEVVELAYSLNSIVLEIRRYEKNFLLYETDESLQENKKQLLLALDTVEKISELVTRLKVHPILLQLQELILAYQKDMEQLEEFEKNLQTADDVWLERTRGHGQEMNEMSKKLVQFEHNQIRTIIDDLGQQLWAWSLVAITVGIFMPLVVSFTIFKPLLIIKEAARDIALGRFSKVEVLNTMDEMQQVMEAFNTMVLELEKRQDQLVQSQKLSSIGTLAAGIAHQLNNPLNNISTSCQIARSEFDAGDRQLIQHMLQNVDQETNRARDVVQGLLEFSREKEFELQPAALAKVVRRAVSLVRSQVPSAINIAVIIPDDLVLPMDSQRMQEVFLNLIINASQAINGSGVIRISANLLTEKDEVLIKVEDTGEGIAEEIQDRLFDPFFTTKEEGKGTGLGLSITYGIIQKHQGVITVSSKPCCGASFLIRLPLHAGASGA
jgi:signal transduction histidine kinase